MRFINYLKNRFEFALKNSGTIKVNQSDVNALNDLISWANTKQENTQLEDSLLLFWALSYWSVELKDGKPHLNEEPKGYLALTDLKTVFDRLATILRPKDEVMNEIVDMLQINQMLQNVPKEKKVKPDEVISLLEKMIHEVKNNFTPISQLKKCEKLQYHYPQGLTDEQRTKFGITR